MKKKITYKKLQEFDKMATNYLVKNGYFTPAVFKDGHPVSAGEFTNKEQTKLVANMKNIVKQGKKAFEEFTELQNNIYIDNCAVDEKTKVMILDAKGGYQFTPEKQKEVYKKIKELVISEIEIHARITEGEWGLTDEEKEAFNGIIIPEFKTEETE